jgi:predicted amidophosphoribosyltransferase
VGPAGLSRAARAFTALRSRLPLLLFPSACGHCGAWVEYGGLGGLCARCWDGVAWLAEGPALAVYEGAMREAVHAWKFGLRGCFRRPFAAMLADRASGLGADAVDFAPSSAQGLKERGFDPMEELASDTARRLKLPLLRSLRRLGGRPKQATLGREERLASARGAYAASGRARGRTVLLLDDVRTTGATLAACEEALRGAGALTVIPLALAAGELRND